MRELKCVFVCLLLLFDVGTCSVFFPLRLMCVCVFSADVSFRGAWSLHLWPPALQRFSWGNRRKLRDCRARVCASSGVSVFMCARPWRMPPLSPTNTPSSLCIADHTPLCEEAHVQVSTFFFSLASAGVTFQRRGPLLSLFALGTTGKAVPFLPSPSLASFIVWMCACSFFAGLPLLLWHTLCAFLPAAWFGGCDGCGYSSRYSCFFFLCVHGFVCVCVCM